jgi:S-formylglutathione hydrolase FrmB
MTLRIALSVTFSVALTAGLLLSQNEAKQPEQKGFGKAKAPERPGSMEKITVHGISLEGNLEGDSPERDLIVYTPPSYAKEPSRRYPVLYFLHGYGAHADLYTNAMWASDGADKTAASGTSKEMIIVFPDAFTKYSGSMYSNSATTGDWETFITQDLVRYIDSHYRTMPTRESRGLAGHSMGGYGAFRIGMKHPEMYAALYPMSSCCLMNNPFNPPPPRPTGGDNAKGKGKGGGFALAGSAQAAAWAPNPMNPPDFFDLPVKDGQVVPAVAAKYLANSPLAMVDQYASNLKNFRAVMMDCGTKDTLFNSNNEMDQSLTRLGVKHAYETYDGDHTNRLKERWEESVMPFFAKNLAFATKTK